MFTPLVFPEIGTLLLALTIFAFVVAMFCLMLIGLGALIALPLTLIMPLFGKRIKWDKDLFFASLLLTPITFLLGMLGIELAKIFGQFALDVVNRFPVISGLIIVIIGGSVVSVIVSNMINYKLSKESRLLAKQIKQAERVYDLSQRDTLKERKDQIDSDMKKRGELIQLISCTVIGVLYGIYYIIFHT